MLTNVCLLNSATILNHILFLLANFFHASNPCNCRLRLTFVLHQAAVHFPSRELQCQSRPQTVHALLRHSPQPPTTLTHASGDVTTFSLCNAAQYRQQVLLELKIHVLNVLLAISHDVVLGFLHFSKEPCEILARDPAVYGVRR